MFYCNKCGKERGWPTDTLSKSIGPCEICGKQSECNDIPSKHLPKPKDKKHTMPKMKTNIQYNKTDACEDKNTIEAVLNLCKNANIETAGAINIPFIHIKEYDDGDQGIIIEIETWPHNDSCSKSVYKFIGKLWQKFPQATIYPETVTLNGATRNQYRVDICTHMCDPN